MKIDHNPAGAAAAQQRGGKPSRVSPSEGDATTGGLAATPSATVELSGKTAPPGLQRVLAKFQVLGENGLTRGQAQALERVARNLARYEENQAVAPLPPVPPPVDEPVVEAPAEEPVAEAPAPAPADEGAQPAA